SSPTDLQTLHVQNDTSTWTDPYGYELIIRAAKLAGDFLGVVRRRGTEPLSNNASHMTWKASLKVQGADPGWPDSDARHPYSRLAILVKEGLRALLAKIAPRRLFEFRRQSIYLGHGRFASNQK